MLPLFPAVCDAIDRTLTKGEGVLVWDVGGGVAAVAAYSKYSIMYTPTNSMRQVVDSNSASVMKEHELCLPEAMMVITRARLMRERPRLLPSRRIIDMLHNDTYQEQLEMWQACKYDIYQWVITNPERPREEWIVEKVEGTSEEKRDDVSDAQPRSWSLDKRFLPIAEGSHRLSTIEEVEEEARRLSMILEE